MTYYHIALLLTICMGLIGCSKQDPNNDPYQGVPEKALFSQGQQALAEEDFPEAVKIFESFEVQHPLSRHAEQVLIEYVYAQYRRGEYDIMQAAADRFIRLYPRSKHIDYIYYIKGIGATENKRSIFDRYFAVDLAARDNFYMRQAYDSFSTIVKRYPKGIYAEDAARRMTYLRNLFAAHELKIAQLYLEKTAYVAAANRALAIITTYRQAPQVEAALAVLIQANEALGLKQEVDAARKLLQLNFPESAYL